ncbi:MFS transporter [Corynebacterium caspium]|uniref:MFS transporter n=1 Tax=Corynebacterium caspium TaxID=234828 RepID=UPI00037D45E2|nr:MFS transporter [Corynebacterium caspium]WKD59611.1 putative transporter YycB [Corynebacterium caspium DSM 44850]
MNKRLLIISGVILAAVNLRAAIVVVGSVLDEIVATYQAPGGAVGILTALPGFCFAIFGLLAVPISRRLGLSNTLLAAGIILLLGQIFRPFMPTIWAFILLTGVAVAGIAITNVLLPAWIKAFGGKSTVLLMTLYTSFLGIGSAIGPLSPLIFDNPANWRWAVLIWAIPVIAQVAVWIFLRGDTPIETATYKTGKTLWHSPTAVWLMLFFGLQSMTAYVQMGWLPKILIDAGASASQGAIALSLLGVFGFIGGLVVPGLIAKYRHVGYLAAFFSSLTFCGYLGLIFAPLTAPYLWATLLGIGGFCFVTAIALIPARTRDPQITARLSGFVQPLGYLLAACGPLTVGVAYGAVERWEPILFILAGLALVMGAVGFLAGRYRIVDAELSEGSL